MRTNIALASTAASLLLQAANAAISPDYHSLVWKFNDGNFWAPLGLEASTYALESPAGAAPEALSRRHPKEKKTTQYLPCTVINLADDLSAKAVSSTLEEYKAVGDDVWSEEQVRMCLARSLPDLT